MNLPLAILEQSVAYRLWQAPFAEKKFAPILAHNDLSRVRRVLDVGCGPGTNTHHFVDADYLGIDLNPRYIESARRRHHRNFAVADVTEYAPAPGAGYDFILVNSFFHHIDTPNTLRILSRLKTLLAPEGHIHILDLVFPGRRSIARLLARCDRGKFARPFEEWREIFSSAFEPVVLEPYAISGFGTALWNMLYFKGRSRR